MIKRIDVSHRFSEVAIYNGIAYLAGQVPTDASKNAYEQTKQRLINFLLKRVQIKAKF